jgi:release factor glutamine methyltransferase
VSRAVLLAFPERPVDPRAAERYVELVERRAAREPFAYLVGEREFYGRPFLVDRRVLVPRPETETLVEEALRLLGRSRRAGHRPLVVDVGTGSGAIACTVAAEAPHARVAASDVSADALAVARENRDRLGLGGRVALVRGSLLAWLRTPADLVLANLPYLPASRLPALMPEVAAHEPHVALFAGDDGFDLIRALLDDARRALRPGGSLLLELDPEQVALVRDAAPWAADVSAIRDLLGHERVVRVALP